MKQLELFAQGRTRALIKHLKQYGERHKSETLHKIRVDIKKIKAILSAVKGTVKGFRAHKTFKPYRTIFRRIGEVRESDVLASLLSRYKVPGIVRVEMHDSTHLIAALEADVPGFIRVAKDQKLKLKAFSKKVHHDHFVTYLTGKKKEVRSRLFPLPEWAGLHKVRKSIKEILYLSEAHKLRRKEVKFFDRMQDIIGSLHDKRVLLDYLENRKNPADRPQRRAIRSDCRSDEEEILKFSKGYYGN